jgi:hypothetical protein
MRPWRIAPVISRSVAVEKESHATVAASALSVTALTDVDEPGVS